MTAKENSRAAAKGIEAAMRSKSRAVSPSRYFLPYQLRWINDPSDLKQGDKSRQIGWTWMEAYDATSSRFRATDARKVDYWLSSADESAGAEFIGYCEFFGRKFFDKIADRFTEELTDPHTKERYTSLCVRCPNGKRITAMSSNPRRFRGKRGDVGLDEFDFHDQPGEMWDAVGAVTQWGGSIRVFTTRSVEGSDFDRWAINSRKVLAALGVTENRERIGYPAYDTLQAKATEMGLAPVFSYHRVTIEDAIAEGICERINQVSGRKRTREQFLAWCRAKCRSLAAYLQEYMCQPSIELSVWLPYSLIESCESDECPQAGDELVGYKGGICDVGVDVGRHEDLTVITALEHVGDVRYMRMRREIKEMSLPDQKAELAGLLRKIRMGRCCIDMSGIGLGLKEFTEKEFGSHLIEGVDMTNKAEQVLAVGIKEAFEDRQVRVSPQDQVFKDDLHKVRKGVTALGHVRFVGARDATGHADRFWSLALALYAGSMVTAPEFEWEPAGRRRFAPRRGLWLPESQSSRAAGRLWLPGQIRRVA